VSERIDKLKEAVVLEVPPIDSAETAVKATITAEAKKRAIG
jgi:hypothetical protein